MESKIFFVFNAHVTKDAPKKHGIDISLAFVKVNFMTVIEWCLFIRGHLGLWKDVLHSIWNSFLQN